MSGINKVILVGNLGADPEVRVTSSGESVTTLSVATSEKWKDKQTGEPVDKTEWHRVVLWRRLAEIAGQYLRKGSTVYIEGALTTRKWTDPSGQDRYTTEIQGNELQMLDGRPSDDSERPSYARTQVSAQNRTPTPPPIDDDVPF